MASQPEKSQIVTASDVTWSGGGNFHGYLLLLLAFPSLSGFTYTKAYLRGQDTNAIRVPIRMKWPIEDGVLNLDVRIWKNSFLIPPSTRWCDFWYDETGNLIDQGVSLLNITTDTYTITPPTLTLPTAAGSFPTVDSQAVPGTQLISSLTPIIEVATGTGSSVTISRNPILMLGLYVNGVLMREGVSNDYTISGTTVTFNSLTIASGDVVSAVFWG